MIKLIERVKKILPVMMMIMMLVTMFSPSVYAYEDVDTNKPVTLTVQFNNDVRVEGMEFKAYKIATLDENIRFQFTSTYSGYGVAIPDTQDGYRALAETLSGYIARDGISPAQVEKTNANGIARFDNLEQGLYIILADRYKDPATGITYVASPSLVSLPNSTDGVSWEYEVIIVPKSTSIPPIPDTPGETIDINVLKVWTGEGTTVKRPESIVAELICDGKVIDSVELNSGNNWRHTWTELDATRTYNVTEKDVPEGYTVTILRDGKTYTINNYGGGVPPVTPPSVPRLPQTGQLWWPVPILAGAGLIALILGAIRKKTA